jgi:uroporphyrinogen-III synthase
MSESMTKTVKDRMKEVRSILVSQPEPQTEKSPYFDLAEKYKLKIDFRPFIQVEPVSVKDFRKQKVDILAHSAVIFTSRNAVDHFFSICKALKIEMPPDMKYFCISEQTAYYLQKYIVIRKRKIFTGLRTAGDLIARRARRPGRSPGSSRRARRTARPLRVRTPSRADCGSLRPPFQAG